MMYRKRCPKCGKEFSSNSRLEIADIEVCDVCHTSLPAVFEEFNPDETQDETVTPERLLDDSEEDGRPEEMELRYVGTSMTIQLPRMAGMVGRVPANCDAIKTFTTISRKQFTYNYLSDGSLEITNNSRFGTVVNGAFLGIGESIIVAPPAIIEMGGCFSFELRKREN